ncbi:MAG: MOSC N-terminal beta barrel domain-containing protein [Chloroflexi bacterium]|nr:MOSC N-terminal beta barrel domain-containing protein [Chloroflexota bacterium]
MISVTGLYIYPIKSCRGTAVNRTQVTPRGLQDDRLLMVVDDDGLFLTQREYPRLALIAPELAGNCLTVRAPGKSDLSLTVGNDGPRSNVGIWRDTCAAVDQGREAAAWFSDYLGASCRLVCIADEHTRTVDPAFARRADDQTGFADGYPFLLISQESLDNLNTRLAQPLLMNRFRPNIVVAGGAPFVEDGWSDVVIAGVRFGVVKPCARCAITTTDQATATVGAEPLQTLAGFRHSTDPRPGVYFGQNLVSGQTGMIALGDPVAATAR